MKLSDYATRVGVTYRTAYRWFKAGKLDAYQLDTGTILVREQLGAPTAVALYARVSSADQRSDLDRQVDRLKQYALARGYQVETVVHEVASGLNDERPKLASLLKDTSIGVIVVENKDRLTRFGFNYITMLLETQQRRIEVVFPGDTKDDLVNDFVSVITSMAARIYGKRGNRNRAERIRHCVEKVAQDESLQD